MRDFFDYRKGVFRERIYKSFDTMLTPKLRFDIAWHCHRQWIKNVSFFKAETATEAEKFSRAIGVKLQHAAFPAGEVVFARGELASAMYIITRGIVFIGDPELGGSRVEMSYNADEQLRSPRTAKTKQAVHPKTLWGQFRPSVFSSPGVVGDEMLLSDCARYETASSLTYVDLLALPKTDLQEILELGKESFTSVKISIRVSAIKIALRRAMKEVAIRYSHELI